MAFGAVFKNDSGYVQIDQLFPNQRVIERGVISSGTYSNFGRSAGSLYLRPTSPAGVLYLSSDRMIIYVSEGTISYVVLGDATTYTPPSTGYGIKITNPNTGTLVFSDEMDFPRVRYSAMLPTNLVSSPLAINLAGTYPGQLTYVSIYSLGIVSWQIGLSFVTYNNITVSISSDENTVSVGTVVSQISAQISPNLWGNYNNFTTTLDNHMQIIQV